MTSEANILPLVVEPAELEQHLHEPSLLIIDVSCKQESYLAGHVPGAIFLDYRRLFRGEAPVPNKLPQAAQLSALFSELGLTRDSHVVAYDDEGGGWAGRLLWTLEAIGHTRYSYLNGGILAWRQEQRPQQTSVNHPTPTEYEAEILNRDVIADLDYVLDRLGSSDLAIWDARSPDEYNGVKVNAKRGGHIPGAVNYEWTRAMDQDNALRIRDLAELTQELNTLGITIDKEVITHCQSHHRSGFTWLVAKVLGYPQVRGYDGSWAEWGNHPDTPIEN